MFDIYNHKTFHLVKTTARATGGGDATDTLYYFVSTADDTLGVHMLQNVVDPAGEVTASHAWDHTYQVEVATTEKGCVATARDGSTYTFNIASNSVVGIDVDDKTHGQFNGSYSVEIPSLPSPSWPLAIEKYQGGSTNGSTAVRIMLTPVAIYYVLNSNYDPADDDWGRIQVKMANIAPLDGVTATEHGFAARMFAPTGGMMERLEFTRQEGGYKLVIDGEPDLTYHLQKKDYPVAFMINAYRWCWPTT